MQLKNEKEHNQNKYNIRTINKIKSDVVGVGVPDDPDAKNKYTNKITLSIPTSNIKNPTSNAAITLIALIITIIVLLILAGVTLNMVMGENGLFGKANNAKNKTEVAQYEEELRMCVLELQTDAATNGTTFNMDTIKNKFVEKVKELENTTEIEFPTEESETRLDGIYKGYEFYIDDKYAAHIGDKATGISLTTSIEPKGWTQGPVTATITIKSNNGINNVEPDEGSKNGNNEYIITKENITENTSFEYTVTDGQGNTQTKTVEINTIDKNAPADFTITAENTAEGLKITGDTTDAESGIDKYEYYAKKSTDSEYTKYDSNTITGLASGTYSVYAIAYDKAGNKKSSNTEEVKISRIYSNITAKMVAENPDLYYGLSVTNYKSENGQSDWKIFYSDWKENPDNAHIFLITGDYVDPLDLNGSVDKEKINSNTEIIFGATKYMARWRQGGAPVFQNVEQTIKERFKSTIYDLNSNKEYANTRCISTLLNATNWEKYKDKSGKAEYAIGGATLEMWVESWNQRYPEDKLYCDNVNTVGYYIGTNNKPENIGVETLNKEGYSNKLYYPYKDYSKGTYGYWLAAPSASGNEHMYFVNMAGYVSSMYHFGYTSSNYPSDTLGAIRPVVSLNKDITIDAKESGE